MSNVLASTVHWPHLNEIWKTNENRSQNMLFHFGTTCYLYHQRSVSSKHERCTSCLQQSNVIYQFSCHCDSWYVGRIFQTLQERIKQFILKLIRNPACSQIRIQPKRDCKSSIQVPTTQSLSCESAIGLHLIHNPICAQNYNDKQFSILAKGRSLFHLSFLEAIFKKTSNPILCRQKVMPPQTIWISYITYLKKFFGTKCFFQMKT